MPPLTHALILTAGLGTRLHPLTTVRAKPAVPVAGVPLIRRIIPWLAASGVTDTVLNLHHRPETIAAVVGDGDEFGVRVRYSWEQPAVLGSAGGPRQALDIIGTDTFLIVNGDTLTDLDVGALVDSHRRHDALVTMAVIPNPNPRHYSGLRVDDDGVVLGVVPRGGGPSYHFIGVQVVHRDAFTGVRPSRFANSVGEVYDRLIAERRGSVRVHHCDARFWDIGTVADYWATSLEFAGSEHRPLVQPGTQVDETARVDQCITWDDVHIGAGCRLSRCIITDGVRVERDSVHHDAILLRGDSGETIAHPFEADRHD
jgi:NDP-sugar pyrophosphorylase family protein